MLFIFGVWFICVKMIYMALALNFKRISDWLIPEIITTLMFYLGVGLMVYPLVILLPLLFSIPIAVTLSAMLVLFIVDDIKDWLGKSKKED